MTLEELSQLYFLNREIEQDEQRLTELRAKAESPSTPLLDGMPRNRNFESGVERNAVKIASLSEIVAGKHQRCISERNRLGQYINGIDDSLTRMIFRLRFIDGLNWAQVAHHIGGGNNEKNVSLLCYRYLKKTNADKPKAVKAGEQQIE